MHNIYYYFIIAMVASSTCSLFDVPFPFITRAYYLMVAQIACSTDMSDARFHYRNANLPAVAGHRAAVNKTPTAMQSINTFYII